MIIWYIFLAAVEEKWLNDTYGTMNSTSSGTQTTAMSKIQQRKPTKYCIESQDCKDTEQTTKESKGEIMCFERISE